MENVRLGVPQNFFASLLLFALPLELQKNVKGYSSATISKELEDGNIDIALVPTCDLLTHEDFVISSKAGIAFDGEFSNSFLYYKEDSKDVKELLLRGDVSSNEIILSKLLFIELMNHEVEVKIDTSQYRDENNHYLISGMDNFASNLLMEGFSFADSLAEHINAPYVNYIFASKDKELLAKFNLAYENIEEVIADGLENFLKSFGFDYELNNYIQENMDGVYFELTDNETDGLKEMLMLPYYKGIIDHIKEVNFI